MKKLCAGITASLMLAATAWVGATAPALADYQSDRDALCGVGDANNCSITIRDEDDFSLVEGVDSATVDVVGTPNVSSTLKMYTLRPSQQPVDWDLIKSWGNPVPFTTDASGKAMVKVPIPVLTAPWGAGFPVAFQLANATLELIHNEPITGVDFDHNFPGFPDHKYLVRSARGVDGTLSQTVTDGLLEMYVAGALTGEVYGAQLKLGGKWKDITDLGIKDNGKVDKFSMASVFADVSGYADGDYAVRIFNRTRGIYDLTVVSIDQGLLTLDKNVYTTPGEHLKNGRKWRTSCEAYSQTQRCRTEIWSTGVVYSKGKLVKNSGWHFNNLTYKESKRALWKGNPLGNTGKYTINSRQWRTECDTKISGGNGCRSYIRSHVVQATKKGKSYTYKMVNKEVFNNIVLFEGN